MDFADIVVLGCAAVHMDFVVLECTELCMDFADIVVLELVVLHMGFEDIHNLDVCHMDFVDIQLLEFAVLRMDFVRIVVLDVVSLAPHIVRHIFVPDVEGKWLLWVRRLVIIEHFYSSFIMMPTT